MEGDLDTVLITGGGSGIGLALAERWLRTGSEVLICGRRVDKLREAQAEHPRLHIHRCDIGKASGRVSLFEWATGEFPRLNVLVNNAGIQRRIQMVQSEEWEQREEELHVNLVAPIHLASLFLPHLLKQQRPAIVNVGSGLAFSPLAFAPIYCATKAALHSFTLSLRHQLLGSAVRVIEIIPPAVNTDLGGAGLHAFGVPLDEFTDAVFQRLKKGDLEIAYGFAEQASRASRQELDAMFQRMNQSSR